MIEQEVKLSAGEHFTLPDLAGALDGMALIATRREAKEYSTVYFDSDDLRLARWGLSFRYRAGQGWTLKFPSADSGALLVRDEVLFEGSANQPPPGALDLVQAYLRRAALRPRVRLHTVRRGVLLHDPQAQLVADVVDDAVSVLHGQGVVTSFRELEVEVRPETPPRLLELLVERLRAAGAGAPDPTPKYLRAIGGIEAAPSEIRLTKLPASASLGDVVTHVIVDGVLRLMRHDPVVRLDSDPEGVHQARVATRRLRSDIRVFRAALDPQWASELRSELGWLGGELGAARDADVLLARLSARAQALPQESAQGAGCVISALGEGRVAAHLALLQVLRSDRYLDLLDRLIEAAKAPALLESKAQRRATKALPPLVRRAWHTLEKHVALLPGAPADEDLHRIRILAKRCRYAAEACAPSLGARTHRLASAASDLQDTLGELNDAVVAERWSRDWTAHTRSPSGAFAAGELAELERAAARDARSRWRQSWKRLANKAPA